MAEPFADPNAALEPSFYEVSLPDAESGNMTRQQLALMPHQPTTFLDDNSYERFYNRARTVWEATAEGDLVSPQFMMDLAGSGFDDDTILQLAHAHRRFLQDRSFLGRIRSIGAEPLDWITNATEFAIHNTVDRYAKAVTNDDSATMAGALYTALSFKADDYERGRREGKNMKDFLGENLTSGGDQALFLVSSVLSDPTWFALGALQISKAGRIISTAGKEVKIGKIGRLSRFMGVRTDPNLVLPSVRLGRGEVTMNAVQAWKSGRLTPWIKARMGMVPAERRAAEDILLHGENMGVIQSILPNTDVATEASIRYLHGARQRAITAAGGKEALRTEQGFKAAFESFSDDYAKLFDGRRFAEVQTQFNAAQIESENIRNALQGLDKIIDGSRASAGSKTAAGSRLLEESLIPRLTGGVGRGKELAPMLRESLSTRFGEVSRTLDNVSQELGVFGFQEILPRARWSERLRRWADNANPGVVAGEWTPPFEKITRALLPEGARRTKIAARTMETLTAMSPHSDIRVENPNWPEQVRRIGTEYEFTLPNWKRADTQAFVDDALKVGNDLELKELLVNRQREAFTSLGLSEPDLKRLVDAHARAGGEITRNVFRGKGTTEALFSSQFFNEVATLDPRLLRAAARRQKLKQSGELGKLTARQLDRLDGKDVSAILDAANSTWKSLAAARPAYLFRVTMLSELGRMTAAGGVTPIGSPLAWLNASFPGRGGKIAKRFKKQFDDLGVPEPAVWDDLDAAGLTPVYWNPFEAVGRVKEPRNLGAQFNPQRMSKFMNHADMEGTGITKFTEITNTQKDLYFKGWRKILKEQIAPDPVVQLFWRPGRSLEEARAWLRTEGRAYALGKGVDPEDGKAVRAFLQRQREVFNDMTRADANVISRLDNISLKELRSLDPPEALPISIVGGLAGKSGPEAFAKFVNESVLGKMWDLAGWFSHQVARKGPYRHEFVRQASKQWGLATRAGAKADLRKVVEAATQASPKGLNAAERAILTASRNNAERFVKQTVYDLSEAARWTDLARYVAPFSNAWQEEITRWAQIFMNRPGTPAFMWSVARSAMDNPGFTWEDPTNGRKMLMIPFGDEITSFATGEWNPFTKGTDGLQLPLSIGWDNLSMLNAGGAFGIGAGPWLQVPAELVAKYKPQWRNAIKSAFPFADESIINTIIPASVFRAWNSLNEDVEIAQRIKTVAGHYLAKGERPPAEVLESQATGLGWLNAGLQFLIGGGARADLPPNVQEEVDFIRDVFEVAPDVADRSYLEAGRGEALAAWTTAITEAGKGELGGPPTAEAVNWLLNDRMSALRDQYPEAFWQVSSEILPDVQKYDPIEQDRQLRAGEVDVRTTGQFMDAVQSRIGWAKYGLMLDAQEQWLREQGITSKGAKAAEPARLAVQRYREALFQAHPAWEESYNQWSSRALDRKRAITQYSQMMNEPEFQASDIGRYLQGYFTLRGQTRSAMTRLEYKSLDTDQAFNLRTGWLRANQALLNQYPQFRPFYERYLRFDGMDF